MPMRARLSVISTLLLAGLVVGGLPATAEAQFGKRLKDAVKRTAEDKAIQKTTEPKTRRSTAPWRAAAMGRRPRRRPRHPPARPLLPQPPLRPRRVPRAPPLRRRSW